MLQSQHHSAKALANINHNDKGEVPYGECRYKKSESQPKPDAGFQKKSKELN
jgi:hypothetical protein